MLIQITVFIVLLFLLYIGFKWLILFYRKKRLEQKWDSLRFLYVKIPNKESESQKSQDNTQSMNQNIEIMNQLYKNFSSIYSPTFWDKMFGQNYLSMELLVEKEIIKFIIWVPKEYVDTFEKIISSFYPGCIIDRIEQPKLLDSWKFFAGGYFELAKDTTLPIKTYENFEVDPMDSILSAFSRVSREEKLSLQFLITPLGEDWQKEMSDNIEKLKSWDKWFSVMKFLKDFLAWFFEWEDEEKKEEKKSWFSSSQEQDLDKKAEDEWFEVVIKVLAVSVDYNRAKNLIEDIKRSISQYNYTWLNKFSFKEHNNPDKFVKEFVERSYTKPIGFKDILFSPKYDTFNIKEISSLYHFPHSRYNKNPRIKWQNFKISPAPENLPHEWVLIWHNVYWGVKKEVRIQPKDRFRHFYCIWQTWTWKSTMLLNQAKDDMINNRGFCLIDPHGDLCEDLLDYFPKERVDDLIYFDASNFEYPIGMNAFETPETEEQKDIITNDLVDMFIGLYWHEIFGPRLQDYFRNWALTLMDQPEWGTLTEIVRLFADDAFRKVKLKHLKNPVVRSWWEKTFAAMWDREKAEAIPFFQAKFGQFTTTPIIRNIIGQPTSSFDMFKAMQENKVILVNLSKWYLGEINSHLLGRILTTKIKVSALQRASIPEDQRNPFYLYIDEFQNYVSESIESVLSEARKYKLWLGVAHQYIEQLKQSWLWGQMDLSKAIFGNVWSIMSYKVWPEDADFLERVFWPEFTKDDLVNIDKYKGVMRLSVDSQPTKPFSIDALNPFEEPKVNDEEKKKVIKEISALKWWRRKDLVEKEINYRVWA